MSRHRSFAVGQLALEAPACDGEASLISSGELAGDQSPVVGQAGH